jgi:hypothetical protein
LPDGSQVRVSATVLTLTACQLMCLRVLWLSSTPLNIFTSGNSLPGRDAEARAA